VIDTRTVYMKRNDFDCAVTEEDMQQRVESFSNTNNTCAPFRSSFTKKTDEKDTEYSHQWKQLEHHAGYYICPHGTLVSTKRRSLQVLKPFINKRNKTVSVSFGGSSKSVKKLVLEAYDSGFKQSGGHILFNQDKWYSTNLQDIEYVPHKQLDPKKQRGETECDENTSKSER